MTEKIKRGKNSMTFDKGNWNNFIDKTEENHRKIFDIDMVDLAKKYGTPTYILFEKIIEENFKSYNDSLQKQYTNYSICYAVKANPSIYLLNLLAQLGAGADVASEYELKLALDAKIPIEKIRANGNYKSDAYLEECIKKGIIINVDPEDELNIINNIAKSLDKNATVNIRLSGFPIKNITSRAISTSTNWSKFGIDYKRANLVFQKILKMDRLNLNGLMVHIGSQITNINAYHTVLRILIDLFKDAKEIGFNISEIDIGGGLGIQYFEPDDWKIIKDKIKDTRNINYTWANEFIGYEYNSELDDLEWIGEELSCQYTPDTFIQKLLNGKYSEETSFKEELIDIGTPRLVIEPGRSIIGNACVTITKVGHVSKIPSGANMVHVDAGVNTYTTFGVAEQLHRIEIANFIVDGEEFDTFVAGNLCFTGDLLGKIKNKLMRKPMRGDYLLFYDTGAYSDFFASNANSFPRPAKVMVTKDGSCKLLVKREDFSDVINRETEIYNNFDRKYGRNHFRKQRDHLRNISIKREETINLIAEDFSEAEPMTKSQGITAEEFHYFAEIYCTKAIMDGLSIIARDKGKVIGFMISEDLESDPLEGIENINKKFNPTMALLNKLDEEYVKSYKKVGDKIFHLFMGGVDKQHEKRHIVTTLLNESLNIAKLNNFTVAIAEATGLATQHILRDKLGFIERIVIEYKKFLYEGRYPFNIEEPVSCILMEKRL